MKKNYQWIGLFLSLLTFSQAGAETIHALIRLKEKIPLEQLAYDVRSPDSPRFGHYYSPEEIQNLSGPSSDEYTQLLQQLKSEGFTIERETRTRLWVGISGDSANFERVFQTQFDRNKDGSRHARWAAQTPSHLALIDSVGGLNNTRRAHPLHRIPYATKSPGGISPATIKSIYNFNPIYQAGLSGKGQHIAIATYNDFNLSDVKYYYKSLKLKSTPKVDKVTFNGKPPKDEPSAMETQLDTEFSGMMAPGASIHVFTSATNDDSGELQLFTAILDDNRAKIVNYSWGSCEDQVDPQHAKDMAKLFAQAVAQGVNILVASGDSGSDSCQNGSVAPDWPAANPDVVAVGGTSLRISGDRAEETAWDGSGGGISHLFDLPPYQEALGGIFEKRSYPDVSFNADPKSGEAIYAHNDGKAGWFVIGGTSMAAPQWAGFLALVGEARAKNRAPTLGFLNPIIYKFSSSEMQSAFNDVTSGSNGEYSAAKGWDAVTGLGSMNAQALLELLSQL